VIRLQRQISYFGDPDGLEGLMRHVGDEEERVEEHIPYKPFSEWPEAADDAF
jgi:hypothetical protein